MQTTDQRTYALVSPSLEGLLSDDALYFEGVSRPAAYYAFRDAPSTPVDAMVLERYWNDVYNLFLRKLASFASGDGAPHEDSVKLQALLQELVKVKGLLAGKGESEK
jgi:hypothetical protein